MTKCAEKRTESITELFLKDLEKRVKNKNIIWEINGINHRAKWDRPKEMKKE